MKVCYFLDDERNYDDVTWVSYPENIEQFRIFRTSSQMIEDIVRYKDVIDFKDTLFSLDHDLQEFTENGELTGYTFTKWLVDFFIDNNIPSDHLNVVVHSKNPIGKKNIESYIKNFKEMF